MGKSDAFSFEEVPLRRDVGGLGVLAFALLCAFVVEAGFDFFFVTLLIEGVQVSGRCQN
jgi:hypothetical protein